MLKRLIIFAWYPRNTMFLGKCAMMVKTKITRCKFYQKSILLVLTLNYLKTWENSHVCARELCLRIVTGQVVKLFL
jgi:hypothetical protein